MSLQRGFNRSCVSKISISRGIFNALPHIDSNEEFVVELIKGFNSMIDPKDRNKFTNMVIIFYYS